jgi:Big-like domain-containing protein
MKCFPIALFLSFVLSTPVFAAVTVSSPKSGSTVTSPVKYVATATAPTCSKGIGAMGIYVNNKLVYTVHKNELSTEITLAKGVQNTVVEEWDKCGHPGQYVKIKLTVTAESGPTVTIVANPPSIAPGGSSTLTVTAANATRVVVAGSDGSKYTLEDNGGKKLVSPTASATYTATATGTGGKTKTSKATVTVTTLTSITVSPGSASFAVGTTQQFTAKATYVGGSTADVTATAAWSVANTAVTTIDGSGLATPNASGATSVTASLNGVMGNAPFTVTIAPGTAVSVPTWHFDTYRSGLNAGEQSLSTGNVSSSTFGKLFTYLVDGYAYAQPLLVSGVTINGTMHNVLYVATEANNVYAFDADNYGSGAPLWHVSLNQAGETADPSSNIEPTQGVTSTPVIDLSSNPVTSNTMYVVSKHASSSGNFFRLSALDITTGSQKLGGPVRINASVPATNSASVNGVQTLTTSCTQRSALLEAYGNIYFGFGSCHTGWMLAYSASTLQQTGVFNASPNLNGEGEYASAGGVWMGGGGPASDGDGFVYITTGNGPWDGQTAWSDSILKFNSNLQPTSPSVSQVVDYFTPQYYEYMDCNDNDMASGGLLLIPGTSPTQALAGAKSAWLYLVSTANLGQENPGDTGALDTLMFESDLGAQYPNAAPFSNSCTDVNNDKWTIQASHYEVYGTSAYFNGSVYLGITAEDTSIPAGLRQFILNGNTLTPSTYTGYATEQEIRGTTPFISANGTSDGVVWMIDQGEPLGSTLFSATVYATLRAFDPNNLANELYGSNMNPTDMPGYGIKFTSPIVANGKVYISTGKDLPTATSPRGRIDVYGLN